MGSAPKSPKENVLIINKLYADPVIVKADKTPKLFLGIDNIISGDNADIIELRMMINELRHTPVLGNDRMIDKAREKIMNIAPSILSSRQKILILSKLQSSFTIVVSDGRMRLLGAILQLVDDADFSVNEKVEGLVNILVGTHLSKTDFMSQVIKKILSLIDNVTDRDILIKITKVSFAICSLNRQS